jgi:diguanylate cyclase (GGDEF)-like protein/PAS domain S-box-containing protein
LLRDTLNAFTRYLLALVILAIAVSLRFVLFPVEAGYPHLTIYPATILSFLLCGFGPGVLVTLISAIVTYYYFLPPFYSFELRSEALAVVPIYIFSSALIGFIIYRMQDITKKLQIADEKLHLTANVFSHSHEGIMITEANGKILEVNEAFSRITGYSRSEVVGQNPRIINSGYHKKDFFTAMWQDMVTSGHWCGEIWNRRKDGEVYAVMQNISSLRDKTGNIQNYIALFSDITAFKEHEKELQHIAHYDALTNLPNRALLADRLQQAIAHAHRDSKPMAVAYLDLDGFKAINDQYGHEIGDKLLVTLSRLMKETLREGDTLSRLGGDEFVIVLPDLENIEACEPTFTRLLAAVANPIRIGNLELQVSASLGASFYSQPEEVDADQLLRQADQAMYQAKVEGKNRFHVFDADQDRNIRIHHEDIERISRAIAERELVLYYQPKVNMRTGLVIGVEALIRWQHPEKGLLSPDSFLPIIEHHPLCVDLGQWVIDTALTQIGLWTGQGLDIPVSVNISAYQLQQTDFIDRLHRLLNAHPQVNPGMLELEVLETSALEDLIRISAIIEECRKLGVLFTLDDFGTGYSSLTYLKYLPVSRIKIDKSFVSGMLNDMDDLSILEGVLGLAFAFRRQVIAEGVESAEHGAMLLQIGCDLAQGSGIAWPMPAAELPGWISVWRPDPSWRALAFFSQTNLPLLFASTEHRAWISSIESHLKGERQAPLQMNSHQCRFGIWLDADSHDGYEAQHDFQALKLLHRQLHDQAIDLCQRPDLSPEQLPTELAALHDLLEDMLERLKLLAH